MCRNKSISKLCTELEGRNCLLAANKRLAASGAMLAVAVPPHRLSYYLSLSRHLASHGGIGLLRIINGCGSNKNNFIHIHNMIFLDN